jgi:hypothetical protein
VKLMPHKHPEDRIYTIMSGIFYIGLGDQFDGEKVQAYLPVSVIVLPGNTFHLHWGEVRRVRHSGDGHRSVGSGIFDPGDDPRKKSS